MPKENENILQINVIRHGKKGADGLLTDIGRQEAFEQGKSIGVKDKNIKVYTSDIERARETGDLINTAAKSKYKVRSRSYLAETPYDDEKLSEFGLDGGKWLFLAEDSQELPNTQVIAGKLSKFILEKQAMLKRVKDTKDISIIAVSHVPTIMCFMSHIIAKDMGKPEIDLEVVDRLRESMGSDFTKTLEGFNVSLTEENISVSLGDMSIEVDRGFLEDLESTHNEWLKQDYLQT